jgi:FAD dependent oxidoreductase
MDFPGGQSVWQNISPASCARRPLDEDIHCDALVVGSGITGALIAFHLAEAGCSVTVIDRRPMACGGTPASTALLQYDVDTPWWNCESASGVELPTPPICFVGGRWMTCGIWSGDCNRIVGWLDGRASIWLVLGAMRACLGANARPVPASDWKWSISTRRRWPMGSEYPVRGDFVARRARSRSSEINASAACLGRGIGSAAVCRNQIDATESGIAYRLPN